MYNRQYLDQLKLRLRASSIVLDIPSVEIPSITAQLKRIGVTMIAKTVSASMDILITSKYTQYKAGAKNLAQKGYSISSIINNRFTNQLRNSGTLDFTLIMYSLRKKKSIIHLSKLKEFFILFERDAEDGYPNSLENLTKYSLHAHLIDTSGTYKPVTKYFDKKAPAPRLFMHSIGSPFVNQETIRETELERVSIQNINNNNKRVQLTKEEIVQLQWEDLYEKRVSIKREGHCYICGVQVKCFSRHLSNKEHINLTKELLPKYTVMQHLFEKERPLLSNNFKSQSSNSTEEWPAIINLNKVGMANGIQQELLPGNSYAYFDAENKKMIKCKLEEDSIITIQQENLNGPFIYNPQPNKKLVEKENKLKVDPKYLFDIKLISPFESVKIGDLFLVYMDPSIGIETVVVTKIHPDNSFAFQIEAVSIAEEKKENKHGKCTYEKKPFSVMNKNIKDFKYKIIPNNINNKSLEELIKNENIIISTLNELNAERYKVEDYKNDTF